MPKVRTKQFKLANEYHLFAVDCWWAGLLQGGLKEIVGIEWVALGQMEWTLTLSWVPIPNGSKMNVGHPEYADMSSEDLEEIIQDVLEEFEFGLHEYGVVKSKVDQWGLSCVGHDDEGNELLDYRDDLDDAEKMIATDFLWTAYTDLQRWLRLQRTRLQELDRERAARQQPDYYSVTVDRTMLRMAFIEQMGYDNEWLFDDVEELDVMGDE